MSDQDDLRRAEADLAEAHDELKHATEEVRRAERDIDRAEKELKEFEEHQHHHHEEPQVFFEDVNALESVDFRTPWHTKLTAAWTEAARLLEEPRQPSDRLQTPGGVDLTPYVDFTLRELIDRKIVTALKFQIVGPTGGA